MLAKTATKILSFVGIAIFVPKRYIIFLVKNITD